MGTGVVIDPRLPVDLSEVLDANEVPHDSDSLLWEIEKHGYEVALDGPDAEKVVAEFRWYLRLYSQARDEFGAHLTREMFHGQTARIVLAQGFAWIIDRESKT